MMAAASTRWYVVQTHPHAENKAARHLGRQGFNVYLPRYRKRRRHARRTDMVAAPLFPRYMFVAIDTNAQRWLSIRSTIGVANLVCNGDKPVAVADSVIASLWHREDADGFVQLERRINFAPGDKVRVIEGVFSASLGLFEGTTDKERVAVLLDLLGRKVRVVMDLELLAAG